MLGKDVWRVEFQLRRAWLKRWSINTIDDLKRRSAALWKYLTTEWVSLRVGDDSNTTRRPVHHWWAHVQGCAPEFGGHEPLGSAHAKGSHLRVSMRKQTGPTLAADSVDLRQCRLSIESVGKPRFVITNHGAQFQGRFLSAFEGVDVVKGKVRQPSFNGKAERLFRTLRVWLRTALLPLSTRPIQRRLDCFRDWYNEHRPHAALGGQTPNEAWEGVELPAPIPIRQAQLCEVDVAVSRQSFQGDPHLPIVSVRIARKEAA